jgi:putative ABC transport system permease protein
VNSNTLVFSTLTRRKRLRTFFTVASIAASMFGLTMLLAVVNSIESSFRTAVAPRVIVHSATSLAVNLPYSAIDKLRQVPGVIEALPWTWFGGTYKQDQKNFFAQFATTPEDVLKIYPEYIIPDDQMAAWKADRTGCVIGEQLAKRFKLKVGDKMPIQGTIYPIRLDLTVRGIMKSKNATDNTVVMMFQRDYMEELLGRPGSVGSFWLRLKSAEDVAPVMRAVDRMFYNSDHETKTETERAFQLQFVSMLGNIRAMAIFVGILATISILLIVGNTMAMSVRERTSEIAVLKTLGYEPGRILGMVLSESVVLASIGGAVGFLPALALTPVVRGFAESGGIAFLQNYRLAGSVAALIGGIVFFVGFASGVFPAWNSSRLNVVTGLRKVV